MDLTHEKKKSKPKKGLSRVVVFFLVVIQPVRVLFVVVGCGANHIDS